MAFIDSYAASLDPRVQAQITAAIHAAAANIYGEASTVTGHTTRAALATKVAGGEVSLQPFILDACAFASLTAASSDTTVSDAVASLWNEWSGV